MSNVLRVGLFTLVALAMATLVSACDTGYNFSTSPSDQHGVGALPSPQAGSASTPSTASAPPCKAQELTAKGGSKQNPNDVGGAIGDVIISNSATTACELRGAPTLRLLKRGGSAIGVQNGQSVSPVLPGVIVQPKGKTTAELVFTWQNWCGTAPGALEMQIALGDGRGDLVAPLDGHLGSYVPTCVRPNTPSVLRVQYAYVPAGATKLATA